MPDTNRWLEMLSIIIYLIGPVAVSISITGDEVLLPFGDINVLAVTDVHAWVAGRAPHEPRYDADYGDILSFYERVKSVSQSKGKDLFFVMNGDFVDGTGLSSIPPDKLTPILMKMPWSAVNIGNHELYHNETVEFITQPGGFVDHWSGGYLTSNVVFSATGTPIGDRYTVLYGDQTGCRILTFGFLFDFKNNCELTTVEPVEEVVQTNWFIHALDQGNFDAILVLAHMDYEDKLVGVIQRAIRGIVGDEMPIQFITGHSHIRGYSAIDNASVSFEPGHFLDTIGFASFPRLDTVQKAENVTELFQHVFIDANKEVLRDILGAKNIDTRSGKELSALIAKTEQSLGLGEVIGCSPSTFDLQKPLNDPLSLWRLYLHEVVADLLTDKTSQVFMQEAGSLRYPLFDGKVTLNDVAKIAPFDDQIYKVAERITGSQLFQILTQLNSVMPPSNIPGVSNMPMSLDAVEPNHHYDIFSIDFNTNRIVTAVENTTKSVVKPVPVNDCGDGEKCRTITVRELWFNFIEKEWPCNESNEKINAISSYMRMYSLLAVAALVVIFVLLSVFCRQLKFPSLDALEHEQALDKRQGRQGDYGTLAATDHEPV